MKTAEALAKVGRLVTASLELDEVAHRITTALCRLLGAGAASLWRLAPETGELVLISAAGTAMDMERGFRLPPGMGTSGLAVIERRTVTSADFLSDPRISLPSRARDIWAQEGWGAALAVPLVVKDRVVGGLTAVDRPGRAFRTDEIALAEAFADQAAIALHNARLYEESERRRRQAELMASITRAVNEPIVLEDILQRVIEGARELCGSDLALIALREPGGEVAVIRCWAGERRSDIQLRIEPGSGVGGRVLLAGQTFRTDDYESDPRFSTEYLPFVRAEGIVAGAVVPVRIDGPVGGLIYVANRSRRPFTGGDEALLSQLADHAGAAVKRARLLEERERRRRGAEALEEVGRALAELLDSREVGQRIVERLHALLGATATIVRRVEPATGDLLLVAASGTPIDWPERLPGGTGVAGLAAKERRSVWVPDLLTDSRVRLEGGVRQVIERLGHHSVLAVPLLMGGRVIGTLGIGVPAGRVFDAEMLRLAEAFAAQAAIALQNARLYHEVRESETLLARERRWLELIASGTPLPQVLDELCRGVEERCDGALCAFLLLDQDGVHLRHGAAPSLPAQYCAAIDGMPIGPGLGGRGAARGLKEPVVARGIAGDPLWREVRDLALTHGLGACWSVPVMSSGRTVLGTFALYYRTPREPAPAERALVDRVIHAAGIAIERSRAAESLRESEERYRNLAMNVPQMAWIADAEGRSTFISPNCDAIFGPGSSAQFLGSGEAWFGRVHPSDVTRVREAYERLFGEQAPLDIEYRMRRTEGRWIWIRKRAALARGDADTVRAYGVCEDITERRQAAETRARLLEQVLSAQEEERARLARELHDDTAQSLAAVALGLDRLRGVKTVRAARALAAELHQLALRTLEEVRRLAWGLRPAVLDDLGLVPGIERYAAVYARTRGIEVEVQPVGMDAARLPRQVETALYRIAQEALSNVAKHSGATSVKIRLERSAAAVSLSVQDEGRGFDPQAATSPQHPSSGLGLDGMRERAGMAGGSLLIDSGPGQGAKIIVSIPLEESSSDQDQDPAG